MKKVIPHEIRKNLIIFIVIALTLFFASYMSAGTFSSNNSALNSETISGSLLIAGLILILVHFSYNKKKVKADYYYSFPITKRSLFFGKYIVLLVEILALDLLLCLASCFGMMTYQAQIHQTVFEAADYGRTFLFGLVAIVPVMAIVNFFLLLYARSNRTIEGIIYCVISVFISVALFSFIKSFMPYKRVFEYNHISILDDSICTSILSYPTFYNNLVVGIDTVGMSARLLFDLIATPILTLAGLSSIVYFIFKANKEYADEVEMVDSKLLGYKVFVSTLCILIALNCATTFGLITLINNSGNVKSFIFYFVTISLACIFGLTLLQFIAYVIFERTVNLKKSTWITFGIVSVVVLLIIIL